MAEKKKGFHALEQRIHQIEEEDRAQDKGKAPREAKGEGQEEKAAIQPPPAHDE